MQRRLLNIEAHVQRAEVELRNLLAERPHLRRPPWIMGERLRDLEHWLQGVSETRKAEGL